MPTIQEIKKRKKVSAKGTAQKIKTKKKAAATAADQKTKTTEEVSPISKYKEWKLLYVPYPFSTTGNSVSPMNDSQVRSRDEERDLGKYKGLCRNCKKRETCMLPQPEGGVWRCEEYE